ncbi:hypothetical protein N9165_00675 [Akkermansiaceae bacterium]|nr:hypothetical protein [Akkermansiaceae bacterium]
MNAKIAALLIGLSSLAGAQDKKAPLGYLRVMTLGAAPPTKVADVNGGRVIMEAPDAEIPPKNLAVGNTGEEAFVLRPRLKQATKYIEIQDHTKPVNFYPGTVAAGEPWLTAKAGAVPGTIVAMRSPKAGALGWKASPVFKTFADDLKSFPNHTARVVNFTRHKVGIKLGEGNTPLQVESMQSGIVDSKNGLKVGETVMQVAYVSNNKWKTVFQNTRKMFEGMRYEIYIYEVDRVYNKGEVRVHFVPVNYADPRL